MEKAVPEKKNSLAGLVGGLVIGAAALLPLSGCVEVYSSGYYSPGYYGPGYYDSTTIVVPIYPRSHYGGRDRDFHRPHQQFNNSPRRNPLRPPQHFNTPPRYSPRPPQQNNRPNRNPSNSQRDHRR